MQFQIYPIPKAQTLFDQAVQKAKKSKRKQASLQGKKAYYQQQCSSISDNLQTKLKQIIKSFPSYNQLPPFYQALMKATLSVDTVKKELGRIQGIIPQLEKIKHTTNKQIATCKDEKTLALQWKAFLGRIASLLPEKSLATLENARRKIREFPDIKEHLYTVAIAGFPNVGKTTLFNALTKAKAQVASYAFTTKRLQVSVLSTSYYTVQLIDTPGTLNRATQNPIELQADLALTHCANLIVYLFDLTLPYPLASQEALLEKIKQYKKPIVYFFSKEDLLGRKPLMRYAKEKKLQPWFSSAKELEQFLLKEAITQRSIQ
ncbi:MAG: GTPase [Candidatus Woesearchaeota archaeon]